MPYSLNYEAKIYGGSAWLDPSKPSFTADGGEYLTALTWLGMDNVALGYTMFGVRAAMYPKIYIDELGQTFAFFNIQILTQTDFMKAAKELNLDLSSYNCIHPNE